MLIGLAPGESESYDAWAGFLSDLGGRGLAPPLLVVSDGAPGLIGACEVVLAKSLRQRCLVHRARNVLAKVPGQLNLHCPLTRLRFIRSQESAVRG